MKKEETPWYKTPFGITIMVIIGIFLLIGIRDRMKEGSYEKSSYKSTTKTDNIAVSFQNVKNVDGKYRYFFNIKNNGDSNFEGSVTIDLINKKGNSVWYETFEANSPIKPSLGTSVYTDANTGPTSVHGDYGIYGYNYEVKVGGKEVKSGSGFLN